MWSRSWSGTMPKEIRDFTVAGRTVESELIFREIHEVVHGSYVHFGPDTSILWIVKDGSRHFAESEDAGV